MFASGERNQMPTITITHPANTEKELLVMWHFEVDQTHN